MRRIRPATSEQLARFAAATASLAGERSIVNSAGMLSFPRRRPIGCGRAAAVWGVALRRVDRRGLRLEARHDPALARHRAQGTRGRRARGLRRRLDRARPTRLAVAAVGYGDGYPRNLGSGSPVLVNGERAPLAGPGLDGHDRDRRDRACARRRSWATRSSCGARDCRWRKSPCGPIPFPTSCCAASASASR
jgi:hypothetical protein